MSLVGFSAQNHPQQTSARGAVPEVDDRATDLTWLLCLESRLDAKFTLDVAAAAHNRKAPHWYSVEDDGLQRDWTGRVWCNPPYSNIAPWVEKAWREWGATDLELVAMLLPANRTEQPWWQELVEPKRDRVGSPLRVEFLRGRMRFDRPGWTPGPKGNRPPFGCVLLIWSDPTSSDPALRTAPSVVATG